jgi:Ca2+-binding RTX toxin-like protein
MPTINGTPGNDALNGTEFFDQINGLAGNDIINGGDDTDIIDGGEGDDTIDGGNGQDFIDGGDGNDVIHAGSGGLDPEVISDGAGNDIIFGEGDQDIIFGSAGNDYYDGGTGGSFQSAENDIVTYAEAEAGIVVDLRLATGNVHSSGIGDPADIGVDTLVNIEAVTATEYDDVMTAGDSGMTFVGLAGNDSLSGGAGDDILAGGSGDDILDGGAGIDLADYRDSNGGVSVSLAVAGAQVTGGSGTDTLSNIENLYGSAFADTLVGDDADNVINGFFGDDVLTGGGGADHLSSLGGNARYVGGDGNDTIETAFGYRDVVDFHAGDDQDQIYNLESFDEVRVFDYASAQSIVQDGADVVVTLSATDILIFRNADVASIQSALHFMGTPADDVMIGTPGNDMISGGAGNDTIVGDEGNDLLSGDAGADIIDAGGGDDTIYSGAISPPFERPFFGNNPDFVQPVLDTGSEVDTLTAGGGDDHIFAGFGDSVDGGTENFWGDTLNISLMGATSGVTVDFRDLANDGSITLGGGTIQDIETVGWVEGSNFDDLIHGADIASDPFSQFGPIFGRGGDDHIIAGQATGNIYGGDGNDTIESDFTNGIYYGEAGDDTITVTSFFGLAAADGGSGNDTITLAGSASGGAGNDVITAAFNFNFGLSADGGDGDDTLTGGMFGDVLIGGNGADTINGGDGPDILFSGGTALAGWGGIGWQDQVDTGAEHDILNGGTGDDTIFAGYGDDVDGGEGTNTLSLSLIGATSGVTLNVADLETGGEIALGGGTIQNIQQVTGLWGSNFDDTLTLSNAIPVYGMGGDDTINGSSGSDQIYGGDGADILNAGDGDDEIHGGTGADIVNAGDGDDRIYVDSETDLVAGDVVHGGAGTDTLDNVAPSSFDDQYLSLAGVTLDSIEILKTSGSTGFSITEANLSGITTLSGMFSFAEAGTISLAGLSAQNYVSFLLNPEGNLLDLTGFTSDGFLVVAGGGAADTVIGSAFSDNIYANGGNDEIHAGAGSDTIQGGDGDDLLDGGLDADGMEGGDGDDTYIVDSRFDGVFENAGEGIDTVQASVTFTLTTNVENLVLTGIAAISGNGNASDNSVTGNSAANVLNGAAGNDTLTGNGGNDLLVGGAGNDTLSGGDGTDTASYAGGQAVNVNLALSGAQNTGGAGIDTLIDIENLIGTSFADTLQGNSANNVLSGGNGNDTLDGGAGDDTLNGGNGTDTASYASSTAGVSVDLSLAAAQNTGGAGSDTLIAMENLTGSAFNDILRGNDAGNALNGGAGNDDLYGNGGNDTLTGGAGSDRLYGGIGDDTYIVTDSGDSVFENAGEGRDQVIASSDHTLGANVEDLTLAGSAVTGKGNDLDNMVTGTDSANQLFGYGGNDSLYGLGGADDLSGGQGNDIIVGGAGEDKLTGGAGNDMFVFSDGDFAGATTSTADQITDFATGDVIDLRNVDADASADGDQGFTFVGTSAFSHSAGELRYEKISGDTFVQGDTNGDGVADFMIRVAGVHKLDASAFQGLAGGSAALSAGQSKASTAPAASVALAGAIAAAGLAASQSVDAVGIHGGTQPDAHTSAATLVGAHDLGFASVKTDAQLHTAELLQPGKHETAALNDGTMASEHVGYGQNVLDVATQVAGTENVQGGETAAQDGAVAAAPLTASAIAIPAAELLAALGAPSSGDTEAHSQLVGKILAVALHGGDGPNDLGPLLAGLPGGNGPALAELAQVAQADAASGGPIADFALHGDLLAHLALHHPDAQQAA